MKFLLFVCAIFGLGVKAAFASEPIEGAFGQKFGDVFDIEKAISKGALTSGTPMYEFKPDKGFRSFSRYFVLVTPATHKIYSIWGLGKVPNKETGAQEQSLVMQLLSEKYGDIDKADPMDAFNNIKHITKGSRYVLTKIDGVMDFSIEIRYVDQELEKLAEKERLVIEAKKVDASGL